MPRVTFLRDFDCSCKPGVYIAYKAGGPKLIPTAHAERARAAGVLADDDQGKGQVTAGARSLAAPRIEDNPPVGRRSDPKGRGRRL